MGLALTQCSLESKGLRNLRGHTLNIEGVAHGVPMDRANRYCSYCHGLNLDGGSQGEPSCFQCHGRRWVDRDPELVLAPADHTELQGGRYYHQVGLQTPVGTCDNCHGSDLTGNGTDDTPSCYLCHSQTWQ